MSAPDVQPTSTGLPPELVIDGPMATITLRRPDVANRLEIDDLDLLARQVAEVDASPRVQVLRLMAQGRHFCSGFNIAQVGQEGGSRSGAARFQDLASRLEHARPVTVAVIQGGVYGGATDLGLACDFRIGTPASEMFVPASRLGLLFYGGGMERYVSRLGLATAKRVLLLAEKFNAEQMLACGYLDRLAPSVEALPEAVDALCAELAGMAPLALLGMKKHLNAIARGALDAQALAEDTAVCDASADLAEGARAWKERRQPVFQGR